MPDTPDILPLIRVETRRRWADPWELQPGLRALSADDALGPSIPTAALRHVYGLIDEGIGLGFSGVDRLDLVGRYVRISATDEWGTTRPLWTGVITAERERLGKTDVDDDAGSPVATGEQAPLLARGLVYLLGRSAIDCSYIVPASGTAPDRLNRLLPFNLTHGRGLSDRGNRSAVRYTNPATGRESYVFSGPNADAWTRLDILQYLLAWFAPPALPITLAGVYANLNYPAGIVGCPPTVLAGLNALIDRRRGHGYTLRVGYSRPDDQAEAETAAISLHVTSAFDEAIDVGGAAIAPAATTRSLGRTAPMDLEILQSAEHEYDRIVVRGAPILLTGTFFFGAPTSGLTAAWTAGEAAAYADADDIDRTSDLYRHVYRMFLATAVPAGPSMTDTGFLDLDATPVAYQHDKAFLPQIPFLDEADEYRPLFAAVLIGSDWVPLNALAEAVDGCPNVSVSPLDSRLGVRIGASPAHLLAEGHYSPEAGEAAAPVADYEDLLLTASWPSDEHLQITVDLAAADADVQRTLVIEVPEARLWHYLAGTVNDIEAGELSYTAYGASTLDSGVTGETDRAELAAVAALARAWYLRPRRAVRARYPYLMMTLTTPAPGDLVDWLDGGTDAEPIHVGTPISRIHWDFEDATTIIQTDFAELDFAAATGGRDRLAATARLGPFAAAGLGRPAHGEGRPGEPRGPLGSYKSPTAMLPADVEAYAAQTDAWDRADQGANDGVSLRVQTRTGYDETNYKTLFAYYRALTWDSHGMLAEIGAETREIVDTPVDCPAA